MIFVKKENTIKRLKIIGKYLKKYKQDLIVLSILGLISAIANGVIPYLVGKFFDAILEPSKIFIFTTQISAWLFFIIIWVIIKLIADIVDWRSGIGRVCLSEIVFSDYLVRAFSKILELPISFCKGQKMGDIEDRFSKAAKSLEDIIHSVILQSTSPFLSIIIGLIITFFIQPILSLALMVGIIIYVLILSQKASQLAEIQLKGHKAYNQAFGHALDLLLNIQSVKQSTAENYERKNLFKNFRIKGAKFWQEFSKIWRGITFSQRLIITFTQLLIFSFSIFFIFKGEMTIGELIMFSGYTAMFFNPFKMLAQNWQTIQNSLIAIERAEKILKLAPEEYIPENAVLLSDIKGEIIFDKVEFVYKKKHQKILEKVNFEINQGEKVALVGESGMGKTTIIDLIDGYYFSQKGKILIDGHNIKNLHLKFLRSKIAVVPQEIVLFNDTIKNNIKYGSFSAKDEKIVEAAKLAHCSEFIERFPKKYEQVVGERGIKLSSGQKQRIAIARAILRDPKILILDEPTSALDAKLEKYITESLEKLMENRTTIIIAHRLSTVKKADKILVLDKGKIVEQGRHDDLIKIKNGVYRHLYELQIGF